jgi:4-hydroxybenzoate polyprenyltransferase
MDRIVENKEDLINRREERGASKGLVWALLSASLLGALFILIREGISLLVIIFPFFVGLIYSKGIRFKGQAIHVKKILGMKNVVVAFTWAFSICGIIYPWANSPLQLITVFVFFFVKSFINSVICDCRDIEGDSLAGLSTIPIQLGEDKTKNLLQWVHLTLHLCIFLLIILDAIEIEVLIPSYSLSAGLIYISLYANRRKTALRSIMIHGEWVQIASLRSLLL